jgi:hypothetical protein
LSVDLAQSVIQAASNKKQRHYVLVMFSLRKAESIRELHVIEKLLGKNFPDLGILKLEDPEEGLKVLLLKQVDLIILEWNFLSDNALAVEFARECKQRVKCPVLFLTKSETDLISNYRKQMALYEELDDYAGFPTEPVDVVRKMRKMVQTEGRAAKRFSVEVPMEILRLHDEGKFTGKLVDMSLVGFAISLESTEGLANLAQIRVSIPLRWFGIFHPQYGDYIKFSGRIRRISIEGRRLGCSFEHLTALQMDCLTRMLEYLAKKPKTAVFQNLRNLLGATK